MLVQDLLHDRVTSSPDKIALICGRHRLTYSEIDVAANRLANALIEYGVGRGNRVVIHLRNSVETVVGIFAVLKAGGVFVVVNPTTKLDKLTYILNNCGASALITTARKASMTDSFVDTVPTLLVRVFCGGNASESASERQACLAYADIQADYPELRPQQVNIDLDLGCLIYTSGSTGEPKGVMSDHCNIIFAASSIAQYLENVEDDIVINVLPLSFDYGLYQLIMTFLFGGTLVLELGFAYPAAILKRIEEERVTGFPGVPTLSAIILQMDLSHYNLSSLRYITNTAAALPPSHIEELRTKFPGAILYSMYGLTETKRTLYLPPEQLDKRPGSVGIAIPGTEVWIEDKDGNRVGPDEVGELVVRGRHVMRGYWAAPKATAQRYRPGPLPGERLCYTGDLFRMDDEGYMYFVGREDDIIKSRGEKVAPKEVEAVLYQLPGVVEAAVIGVPDPIMGQAVKAFLVLEGDQLTMENVLAHCRSHLEDLMVPKIIEFRDELPRTESGKIKKTTLT